MALVLTLRVDDDFFVGDERFVLTEISSPTEVVVQRMSDGHFFALTDRKSEEILSGVRVSVGARGQLLLARIAINAPRDITIFRGDRARDGQTDA